ncbi:helix-turn-helix transcriptional regulator [Methanobrevibacter sp.]|uniref:helix-turn-helix transcriptional regulator n=1 Tax=Methanobrevibacter sp. TaxID=66852 RepID=UPI00386C7A6F
MNFDLMRFILTSDMRSNLLLELFESEQNVESLKANLNKSHGSILRGLKELIEKDLVYKSDKSFFLSSTGFLITLNIISLFDNAHSIKSNADFFKKHSIDKLGNPFFKNLHIWKDAQLIESTSVEFVKTINVYSEKLACSNNMNIILPVYSKVFINIFVKSLLKNDGTLNLITNEIILDLINENDVEGIFQKLVSEEKIKIFLSKNDFKVFFTATDVFSSLFLFFDENHFDDGEMLLVEDNIEDSLALFDSYLDLVK